MVRDLAAQLLKQDEKDIPASVPETQAKPITQDASPIARTPKARSRDGQVTIAGWFPVRVKFELEEIRLERSRQLGRRVTMQEILAEAYNDFFKKHGRAELAPTTAE